MKARSGILWFLLAVLLVLLAAFLGRQLEIDRCLDHGGRWGHAARVCEP